MERYRASVTLEFPVAAPETWRGELSVANARLGARRAVEAAFKAHPKRRWSSLVILLEKLDAETTSDDDTSEDSSDTTATDR